uniref:Signal sequence receptor subunit alpha n=1 Tax=Haemonchus placei TaxID=6290 RepID=A0A0N4WSR8_HAEPC
LNLIVTWTLQSRNGSRLRTDYVKSVLIRRFKQDKDGTWTGGEVVSENLAGRINVGGSNENYTDDKPAMLSPSFVMLYLVILVALVLVVLKIYQTKPKKGKHRPKHGRKKKKDKEKKKSKSVTKTKGPSKPSTSKSGSVDEMKMSGMSGVSGSRDDVKKPLQ